MLQLVRFLRDLLCRGDDPGDPCRDRDRQRARRIPDRVSRDELLRLFPEELGRPRDWADQ